MKRFFDQKARDRLVLMLSLGMTRRDAARCLGCHVSTIYFEASKNSDFYNKLAEAESGFEVRHRKRIEDASKLAAHWRASAWAISQKQKSWAARAATQEQVDRILAQFAHVLAAEVPDKRKRQRMLGKLCRAMGVKNKRRRKRKPQEPNDDNQNAHP